MRERRIDAAMLWSGGKDSALALHEAWQNGYRIRCLATFAPPEPRFLAHPLPVLQAQAQALGLPHHVVTVDAPFDKGYESGLCWLRDTVGVRCVVTGDMAEVDGCRSWIRDRSRAAGIDAYMPLWERDRHAALRQFIDGGYRARISCVDTQRLDARFAGRELDDTLVAELAAIGARTGLDLCGENGEYHTLVTDAPLFGKRIELDIRSTCVTDSLAYLDIRRAVLAERIAA